MPAHCTLALNLQHPQLFKGPQSAAVTLQRRAHCSAGPSLGCLSENLKPYLQVRGKWPCQLLVQSLAGSGRITSGGISSSFEQAAGSLLLDGTPIGDFDAAGPTFKMGVSRCGATSECRKQLQPVCSHHICRCERLLGH